MKYALWWRKMAWYAYQASRRLFRTWSNIKVIMSTIWKAAVLVLLKKGFTKYAIEMASCAIIYVPIFMNSDSGIQQLLGWIHIQPHSPQDYFISLLLIFQNKESRLKIKWIQIRRRWKPVDWTRTVTPCVWKVLPHEDTKNIETKNLKHHNCNGSKSDICCLLFVLKIVSTAS
jgi:hypothetical protein